MSMLPMTEDLAKTIYMSQDLDKYTFAQLHLADQWVKDYALEQLKIKLKRKKMGTLRIDFIMMMVRLHYGAVEITNYLTAEGCYPEWANNNFPAR